MLPFDVELALDTLPDAGRETMRGFVLDAAFHGFLTAAQGQQLASKLSCTIPELMVKLVPFAAKYAVTPVSHFDVGAVAQGKDTGNLYYGANMEFSGEALSFCVHGEQAATNNAWINGETGITNLAISAAPCGYCRQFLYETALALKLKILLPAKPEQLLAYYLPDAFGPGDLGVKGVLMSPQSHGLTLQTSDKVVIAAVAAANASYAPYTKTYTGIAVQLQNGAIHSGRYAENAAYNPSLSPLESALSFAKLYGDDISTITRCIQVDVPGMANQADATRAVLSSAAPSVTLEVYQASL